MSLQSAIEMLQAEVDDFGQGTSRQPKEGSADWFLLRAKSLGLSSLKRAAQLKVDKSPVAANRHFLAVSRVLKHEVKEEQANVQPG